MPNIVAQTLHFLVYLVALAAWVYLSAIGKASGGIDSVLPALIGTAAGSVIGYHVADSANAAIKKAESDALH